MSDKTLGNILRDAASMDDLRRLKLAVDFCLKYVECEWGHKHYWGDDAEHSSFEEALAFAIERNGK